MSEQRSTPHRYCGGGGEGAESCVGRDGEIKEQGPCRSMSLMVLVFFRDLGEGRGPGFQRLSCYFMDLSGTCARSGHNV